MREVCEKYDRIKGKYEFYNGRRQKEKRTYALAYRLQAQCKWHYAKRKEVEEELRHYGLIEF